MRRAALEDIATEREERGHRVKVFIHDRILIEDAAATVDLLNRERRIYHHLKRLSYSTTPSDFGFSTIQRRRWANGGLLILPKLLRYAFRRPLSWTCICETAVRIPTLISAAVSGVFHADLVVSAVRLCSYCFGNAESLGCFTSRSMRVIWFRSGYRVRDLLPVYAMNLLLIPILFGGTTQ